MYKSMRKFVLVGSALTAALLAAGCASMASTGPMSFFISSTGSGKGADLGGIAGGDALCQRLATAAGAGGKTWRAYLSTPGTFPSGTTPGVPFVHARDRIGNGPWYNAKGVLIARDLAHLHNGNNISKETALDERGNIVKGRGDNPNEHDILTGTRADGTAFAPQTDTTCKGWTSSTDGSAILGHHDRTGPTSDNWAKSWNFSHQSAGCSQAALASTGGSGRLYCFAAN
ncbi:MAG: lectin [Pseudomonadota bacterium]